MRIVFLTGIWPPDVGGPATHGPDFARYLIERDHDVRVVTMGDGEPTERPCRVETVSRRRVFPIRYAEVAVRGGRAARRADVVYATATYAAAAAASVSAGRPLVAKLVSDPAFERARRYGVFTGRLEDFQHAGGAAVGALKGARTLVLRRAGTIVVPSAYLAGFARHWGIDPARLVVLPNPAPETAEVTRSPLAPHTFAFVGRLTRQKDLGVALDAVELVPEAQLLLVGDGPERGALERRAAVLDGRVVFLGARPREEALGVLAGATAAVLSSAWENLPHAAVEALAVGTPVVATAVGGVPEVVEDGVNGLLVAPGDARALARAMRRLLDEPGLRDRLAVAARSSAGRLSRAAIYGRLEQILAEAAT